jgi:hypothetical protein
MISASDAIAASKCARSARSGQLIHHLGFLIATSLSEAISLSLQTLRGATTMAAPLFYAWPSQQDFYEVSANDAS